MGGRITAGQFHAAEGVQDWRVVAGGACAHFRTGSFAAGVELVDAIGELADAADHHPDVDLRYAGVTVRLVSHDVGGLSERDVALARQISAAARELDVPADTVGVQTVMIAVDAAAEADVRPFWRAVLGYTEDADGDLVDPAGHGPRVWFQHLDAPRPQRNRLHVDVSVPHDEAEARVAAALAAGGRLVGDAHAPAWWTLADAEGNEVDVATWQGRED
jgi:4a-hydroxytetrahydrobiopterin dehydratase